MSSALLSLLGALAAPQAGNPWFSEVILHAPAKLGGCAVGDVDPEHPGEEVVSVSADGRVYLSRAYGRRWVNEAIAEASGELVQVALGDADPSRPGEEIVAVGMREGAERDDGPGAAYLVVRGEQGFELTTLFEEPALLHAAAVADVSDASPGAEIAVAGFAQKLHLLGRLPDGEAEPGEEAEWTELAVEELPGAAKAIAPFAGGLAVACNDGTLLHLAWTGGGESRRRILHEADAGLARLGAASERLAVARDDGVLVLVDDQGAATVAHRESEKLRGAVLADLDPERAGLEAATGGYGKKLWVLYEEDGRWFEEAVHTDERALHHVAAGELDVESPGLEVVACGHSGRLVLAGVVRRN